MPVIVYTGKELTRREETRLKKYAETIIVKDVRSPERLLDETALFLHRVEAKLPAEKRRMIEQLHTADAVFRGKRVLIVDDDVRNVFALTSALEGLGMDVLFAENGRDGIEVLEADPDVDLVLMDMMMPEMDGYETMRRIRARCRRRALRPAADHRPHGQGHEGRPGAVHRRRRVRLHHQAGRRRAAPVAHAGLALPVSPAVARRPTGRGRRRRRPRGDRDRPPARGRLPALRLRLPQLRPGLAAAAAAAPGATWRASPPSPGCSSGCCTTRECMERLLLDLSINVTAMFRDPGFYRAFRQTVVPLLRTYPFLRIWNAGCSTGEETYSLAILLAEEGLLDRTRIYATDINQSVLARARDGVFPLEKMREYTENYLAAGGTRAFSEYYVAAYDGARFDPALADNVVFAQHNLVADRSFNEFHVIVCRNVLIYFDKTLQDRVHRLFYDSLARFGILALGQKESVTFTPHEDDYQALDERRAALPQGGRRPGSGGGAGDLRHRGGRQLVGRRDRPRPGCSAACRPTWRRRSSSPSTGGTPRRCWPASSPARRGGRSARPRTRSAMAPGTVYLAPAGYHLLVERPGHLALSTEGPVRFARPSIDVLFESAAAAYRDGRGRRGAHRHQRRRGRRPGRHRGPGRAGGGAGPGVGRAPGHAPRRPGHRHRGRRSCPSTRSAPTSAACAAPEAIPA